MPPLLPGQHAPGILDVNQPGYPTQIARAFGVQNSVPGQLDPLVSIGVQLDDYTLPEFWWLRRGLLGVWGGNQAAVAGQFGWVGIQGSPGTLTVVDEIVLTNPGAASLQYLVGITTVTPSAGAYFPCGVRDTRGGTASQCATTGGARAAAALSPPAQQYLVSVPAGNSVCLRTPWVLTGALFLSAQAQTVNVAAQATFNFRERPILAQEL